MRNIIIISTFLFAIICVAGCQKTYDYKSSSELEELGAMSINMPPNHFYDSKESDCIVADNIGKYIEFAVQSEYVVGISSLKSSPLVQESIMAFTCPGSGNAITATKSEAQPEVLIDGINIFSKETKSSGMSDLTEYYGRTVNYSVLSPGNTKSEDGMLSQTELYIPKLLCIETPSVTTEDEEYPLCFYKDFVLGWNRDEKNVNGVMVAIEWNGSMVFGESNTNAFIRNTDFFEDTGSVTIPEAMFEGIPDTALCRLTILRGDLDNIVADGSSYKVYGETHAVLPFVLIREIRKIN